MSHLFRRCPRRHTLVAAALAVAMTVAVSPAGAQEHPRVVATILPVQSLVAGVMSGVGTPYLLVPRGETPATYTPTPQALSLMADANLLFMTDESYSADIDSRIGLVETDLNVVTLAAGPGIDGEGASWLDPETAKGWVRAIAAALAEVDQDNKLAYSANAEGMLARLDALQTEIETMLQTSSGNGVLVFDPTLRPFAQRFELEQSLGRAEFETPPPTAANPVGGGDEVGAAEVRGRVRDAGRICRVTAAGEGAGTGTGEGSGAQAQPGEQVAQVDILGNEVEAEPSERYAATLRGIAEDIRTCLDG